MKPSIGMVRLGLLATLLALACDLAAEPEDAVLSPYFFVESDDPSVDRLPLKGTEVEVRIAGVIADIKVTQRYRNEGSRPLEARYIFPGSTRAAVYAMSMRIGERTLVAEIREKNQARAEYTQAKQQGKSAALLEQQRPNAFQMNVANILPADDIEVELSYTELLVPTDATYELVYPTVVGPRYSSPKAAGGEPWVGNPYLKEGEDSTSAFHIKAEIDAGIPLQELVSPSHELAVRYDGPSRAALALSPTGRNENNRDFILKYRLAGEALASGALLYQGEEENFFLAMIEPPKEVGPEMIPPRDYVFVVDVSGSMHGFPLDTAKILLADLIGGLRPTDTFNVLLFSGGNAVLAEEPLPATAENIARALEIIGDETGGGATELLPALRRTLALPREPDRSRSIVVVTDGYVTVETEAFDLIRQHLDEANLFAFGIGSSVNRFLIEGLARAGKGEPFVVTQPGEAKAQSALFRRYIESPVLTHVTARFEGFDAYDIEPLSLPDVLATRPVVLYGKWRGAPEGRLILTGQGGHGPYAETLDLGAVPPREENRALQYLWARSRIATLSDDIKLAPDDRRASEITALGLRYTLLTAYTSFVAVDQVVRNRQPGDTTTVKQPLPLPAGVSALAVGGEIPTTPEPETYLLLMVSALMLAWKRLRSRGHVG